MHMKCIARDISQSSTWIQNVKNPGFDGHQYPVSGLKKSEFQGIELRGFQSLAESHWLACCQHYPLVNVHVHNLPTDEHSYVAG